jgi:glycosyltransferase involved in cell wall biosynthesis
MRQIERLRPDSCYVFTQVALETLRWARENQIPTVLDNPIGHIKHYGEVFARETRECSGSKHLGHPTQAMIARVEEEYELADRIRVSSEWAKGSLISYGVSNKKIQVVPQPLNLIRFRPSPTGVCRTGPLQVLYVGSLNLAKGFQYLTRAIRRLGAHKVDLEIVGATGTRAARRVFQNERRGINVTAAPGDPLLAYQRAEIFVLPSLHDGFGFVVGEAMACGLPVIVTENCGASSWIRNGKTGWIIPPGRDDALADAMTEALSRRAELNVMGKLARADVEKLGNLECLERLREWVYDMEIEPEVAANGFVNVA